MIMRHTHTDTYHTHTHTHPWIEQGRFSTEETVPEKTSTSVWVTVSVKRHFSWVVLMLWARRTKFPPTSVIFHCWLKSHKWIRRLKLHAKIPHTILDELTLNWISAHHSLRTPNFLFTPHWEKSQQPTHTLVHPHRVLVCFNVCQILVMGCLLATQIQGREGRQVWIWLTYLHESWGMIHTDASVWRFYCDGVGQF